MDPEGNKFWFDTKTGKTTLEDPLALSTDDEDYMDKDAEDIIIGWADIRRSFYMESRREAKVAEERSEGTKLVSSSEGKRESNARINQSPTSPMRKILTLMKPYSQKNLQQR